MDMIHWLFGPQLIGVIMLICGYILKIYPPKSINGLYGYRTTSSMKNQQTWDMANNYSARVMIRLGAAAVLIGLLLTQVIDMQHEYLMAAATIISLIAIVIILFKSTEKQLKITFGQPGDEVL